MPVIYNKNHWFGARITEITTPGFHATVSTAKEGFFQGLSTIIIDGAGLRGRQCAKIIYVPHVGKSDRQQFHDLIVAALDEKGMEGFDLVAALKSVEQFLEEKGVISEFITLA